MIGLKIQKDIQKKKKTSLLFFLLPFIFLNFHSGFSQPSFTATRIEYKGLKRTKNSIVQRELTFKSGLEILIEDTALLFKRSALNMFNTKLFNYCSYSIDSLRFDSATSHSYGIVVFHLNERWYTFPIPIFELADRNFNEWWYDRGADLRRVNVGLRFLQNNVRGRNEDLTVGFQGGFTKRMEMSYLFPYLDKAQTWGLKFSGSFSNNKDVAFRSVKNRLVFKRDEDSFGRERTSFGIQLSKRRSIYSYHFIEVNYGFNRISDFIFDLNQAYFNGSKFQRSSELKYVFTKDKRNLRNFATKGYLLSFSATRIGFFKTDNFRLWALRTSASKYFTLADGILFSTKIDGEISTPEVQPYYGNRVLGFENRFARGYERYIMEGPVNFFTRNTFRVKAFSRNFSLKWMPLKQFQFMPMDVYVTAFGDAGYVKNSNVLPENTRLVNTLLVGYGLGLNFVTFYDIVFRTEFSLNRQGDSGLYFSFLSDI